MEPTDEKDRAHWDAVEDATELLHEEKYQAALLLLRDVIKADAKNPYGFFFMGVSLFELGELEAARDAYEACLRVAPKHLGARVALSHVLRSLGDHAGALQKAMGALAQAPEDGEAIHAVGLAYLSRGDMVAARRYLSAFLETGPEFEVATEVRAILDSMEQPGGSA